MLAGSTRLNLNYDTLKLHPVLDLHWSTVATDVFELSGQHCFVVVESSSGWFEIDLFHNLTSNTGITKIKTHFSVQGSPHKVISHNGTQFTS